MTTIFPARGIHTMNPAQPTAEAVAVTDGRIAAVGTLADLRARFAATIDDRFETAILLPGFVEGHAHILTGGIWQHVYTGFYDRLAPDGTLWKGLKNFDQVIERLREAASTRGPSKEPLLAWGFDPIFFGTERMSVAHLDQVTTHFPIVIMHQSFHAVNVNSVVLGLAGIDGAIPDHAVPVDAQGMPTGELREIAAMTIAMHAANADFWAVGNSEQGLWDYGRIANLTGATVIADLVNRAIPATAPIYRRITDDPKFPARLFSAMMGWPGEAAMLSVQLRQAMELNTEKLRFGAVKFVIDGTLQGFTARLRPPGFHNGAPNGMWNLTPAQFHGQVDAFHREGFQLHIHTNGDEATELAIETLEKVIAAIPRPGHRHTLQHCQLADADQFRRMLALGLCANIFSNHVHYYGDIHYTQTVGPERAERMNAAATALRIGLPISIHSDAPVTPFAPLFTAWIAVNRLTAQGRVLGEAERLTVPQALRAITMGAAYTLHMDHEAGSIEPGKQADFAVLGEDPYKVDSLSLKDVPVLGTVLAGQPFTRT